MSNETKYDFIPFYDPVINKVILVSQEEYKEIGERFSELLYKGPNFETKTEEQK